MDNDPGLIPHQKHKQQILCFQKSYKKTALKKKFRDKLLIFTAKTAYSG